MCVDATNCTGQCTECQHEKRLRDARETRRLVNSPLVCAIADDWLTWRTKHPGEYAEAVGHPHTDRLDKLEELTRKSALRKVKP